MEYGHGAGDAREHHISDFVQWQGSQTACAALDTLLSEAAFKPQPEFTRRPRNSVYKATSSPSEVHCQSPSTLILVSPSSSFTTASGSSTSAYDSTPPSTSNSKSHISVPSRKVSSAEHRTRPSRPSNSTNSESLPVRDPDQFLIMLKGISERVDGSLRNDAGISKDNLKQRRRSKRATGTSSIGVKRAKQISDSRTHARSEIEGPGRMQNPGSLDSTSVDRGTRQERAAEFNRYSPPPDGDALMDVDFPKPSLELMPPPPAPSSKPGILLAPSSSAVNRETTLASPVLRSTSAGKDSGTTDITFSFHSYPRSQRDPHPRTGDVPSTSSNLSHASTPKLHPLLDPERKKRRLKLERTISASLASSPSETTTPSNSSSQTTASVVPPARRRQHPLPNRQPPVMGLSQGLGNSGPSRPPPLGMRRTHTFPLASQNQSRSDDQTHNGLTTRLKHFKPPLLSTSQPPLLSSQTNNVLPRELLSQKGTHSEKHSSRPPPKPGDQDLEDIPPSSDADISFGEAVSFDVDMDALEETMRKYD